MITSRHNGKHIATNIVNAFPSFGLPLKINRAEIFTLHFDGLGGLRFESAPEQASVSDNPLNTSVYTARTGVRCVNVDLRESWMLLQFGHWRNTPKSLINLESACFFHEILVTTLVGISQKFSINARAILVILHCAIHNARKETSVVAGIAGFNLHDPQRNIY
jgi:hypothetical protein